ncbi:hypothetical protein QQM79_16570 [Marinobacteraceae bacterium S3BR75-40.1]
MEKDQQENGEWNQVLSLRSGETLYNELSGLSLWVTLLDKEWQIRHTRQARTEEDIHWLQRRTYMLPGAEVDLTRFVRADNSTRLQLAPRLADRSVVIRPYHPFHVLPQNECTIYVSTVLWMQVLVGEEGYCLTEMPIQVPSLTWLGRNTQEGDICYASGTSARLALEALPRRPWRAITAVRILNRGKDALKFERFSLPALHLPLFQGEKRGLWTPAITVTCDKDLTTARMDIATKAPAAAGEHRLISQARQPVERGGLVRALDRIFG